MVNKRVGELAQVVASVDQPQTDVCFVKVILKFLIKAAYVEQGASPEYYIAASQMRKLERTRITIMWRRICCSKKMHLQNDL